MNRFFWAAGKLGIFTALLAVYSCDIFSANEDKSEKNTLEVKFENSDASDFAISVIQLQAMGAADEQIDSATSEWSENLLGEQESISPGEHRLFTLPIPNLHYSRYRLGVIDEDGAEVLLHEQQDYGSDQLMGTITHWGSDDRSVSVTVQRNEDTGIIAVMGYEDWAGIE